jgi:hypothetical protein
MSRYRANLRRPWQSKRLELPLDKCDLSGTSRNLWT